MGRALLESHVKVRGQLHFTGPHTQWTTQPQIKGHLPDLPLCNPSEKDRGQVWIDSPVWLDLSFLFRQTREDKTQALCQ